jgi:hypothetical protein
MHNRFDIAAMSTYVGEILSWCQMPTRHAEGFVLESLKRKKRFHGMNFDKFGRCEIPFHLTPKILLNDYQWFPQLLDEMGITQEALTVMMGKIFVLTARGGGAPLCKELSKKADKLFSPKFKWYNSYEFYGELKLSVAKSAADPKVINKLTLPEAFLKRLGAVVNLGKKAVISINPGDIIRKSINGKYSTYNSCHNLKIGMHKQGAVNYAMDSSHVISYVCGSDDPAQVINGRSMVVVSDDLGMVGQRRFYPSPEDFGASRAQRIREEIHRMLCPGVVWRKSSNTAIMHSAEANNGYLDAIAVATYREDYKEKQSSYELCPEIFCFSCGKVHTNRNIYCRTCNSKGVIA